MNTQFKDKAFLTRRSAEIGTAVATALFGAVVMIGATENPIGWTDLGPSAGLFPFCAGLVVVIASIGTMIQAWLRREDRGVTILTAIQLRRIAIFFLPIVAYVLLVFWLGLYAASALYLLGSMLWQGRYGLPVSMAVSLATTVAIFILFEWCFQMPLVKGPIEAWLGIY